MNNFSSLMKHHHQMSSEMPHFDTTPSHEDFLEQILASVPNSGSSFPWADEQQHSDYLGQLDDQSAAALESKQRQHQISAADAKALMLHHQQLLLRRDVEPDHNDVVDRTSFDSANPENDASVKSLFNSFNGSLGQISNKSQHFHHPQVLSQNQPAASGSSRGGAGRQRVRAKRGQATDPHSIAERLRRERIAERMKALQELVPNGNKTDKASMLDEIIDYLKFLQLQVKVLSVSRLGGAAAVAPALVADKSSEGGRMSNIMQAISPSTNDVTTRTENDVAKLLEEDMGSAMQYLQGKGLCLMPISLASAISAATRNPLNVNNAATTNGNSPLDGGASSPSMSGLTVQSATIGAELSLKTANSISKQ